MDKHRSVLIIAVRVKKPNCCYRMGRLASFLALFSVFLSFAVLDGAFLVCFFLSIPLLIVYIYSSKDYGGIWISLHYTLTGSGRDVAWCSDVVASRESPRDHDSATHWRMARICMCTMVMLTLSWAQ